MGNILIVEDNEIICDALKNIVMSVDASQDVYSTGYSAIALERAKKHVIDVFLLDIELLDYSGIILAKKIREIGMYKMTPIVFITNDYKLELEAFRNVQCYKFITKPFKTEDVKDALKTIFEHGVMKPLKSEKLILKQRGFTISLLQKNILYFELRGRKLVAVTCYEETEINTYTLTGVLEALTEEFFRCHKSIIVNSDWIYQVDRVEQLIHLRDNRGAIPYGDRYKGRLAPICVQLMK